MPSNLSVEDDLSIGKGLRDRVAVVTGASSGIGRETALLFERVGARVFATSKDQSGLDSLARSMKDPDRHYFHVADLANTEECEGIISTAVKHFGELFVLAHVAGALIRKPLFEVTESDWDYQQDVNLRSGFFLNRAACKTMLRPKHQVGYLISPRPHG